MTKPPQTKTRLTVGEWTGLVSLAISLIAGAVEMRVQIATLRSDVAAIRHDLDWLEKVKQREGPAKAPAPIGRQEVAQVVPRLVQNGDLARPAPPSIRPAAAVRSVPEKGPDRTGDRGGPHKTTSRRLDALHRPRKFAVAFRGLPQQ